MGYQFGSYHDGIGHYDYFRVPDARDTVMGVVGSVHPMGQRIGNETHHLSESEMPEHVHYFVGGHGNDCGDGSGKYIMRSCTEANTYTYSFQRSPVFGTEFETSVGGSNQSFSLLQPTTKFIGNLFVYSGEIHS
eukprot:169805_1